MDNPTPIFPSAQVFVEYLRNTLIPDLEDSGMEMTAKDFHEAIYWIEKDQHGK